MTTTGPSQDAQPETAHPPVRLGGTAAASRTANVAAIIVTWNRWEMVDRVLAALSRQGYPLSSLDITVIDNGSDDGTIDELTARWKPDRIVDNPTERAHEPNFQPARSPFPGEPNAGGFRSLNLVANTTNMGGCGGFNTGFAFVEQILDAESSTARPDYVWLVDDDVDLPANALEQLTRVAEQDPSLGLVGSRTVDIGDRDTTIETTIYFNEDTGLMADEPTDANPLAESHRAWVQDVGGTKGSHDFRGVRPVNVVSACSLLARWSAVREVGFWDWRYFIYCDDADWCLRFAKAGHGVVCNLDAVVYHTPWHLKLTPARIYYAQRNMIWVLEKIVEPKKLRRVVAKRVLAIVRDAQMAALRRRLFHAEVIRRTAHDLVSARAGKLDWSGPRAEPVRDALSRAGAADGSVLALCNLPDSLAMADRVRECSGTERTQWTYLVRNDVDIPQRDPNVRYVVYGGRRRSKLKQILRLAPTRPDAVVVFDQNGDMPLITGRHNLHIDRKDITVGQLERDGIRARVAFFTRWTGTLLRSLWYIARVQPNPSSGKYG